MNPTISDPRLTSCAGSFLIAALAVSCGGGSAPASLAQPRIDIATQKPSKTLLVHEEALGLVEAILPLHNTSDVLVVGSKRVCKVSLSGFKPECGDLAIELWNLEVLTQDDGNPAAIVGSGGFGSPSAAVLDMNGQLKWKYDGGYSAMGRAVISDGPEGRSVVVSDTKRGLLYLDYESGKTLRTGPDRKVLASRDFSGDSRREVLLSPHEDEFLILNGADEEVASLRVSKAYWYEPAVTWSRRPFVVLSAGNVLDVHDSQLKFARRFDAKGAASPLHVVAATFIGNGPDAPFAAIYKGRGGWHRSVLYYFVQSGDLVYKEVLADDYQCLAPLESTGGAAFLVGGRGEVWLYRFSN